MEIGTSPAAQDLERTERWKAWIESCFEEIGKAIGTTNSKGAHRIIGDFEFWYDPVDVVVVDWFVATDPKLPLQPIHGDVRVRWEQAEPVDVASAILLIWRGLQANPMYVLSRRASRN